MDTYWAVAWAAMSIIVGLIALREHGRAEYWQEAHGEAWRAIGEMGAELRVCREGLTR